jgi:hypothetical protein
METLLSGKQIGTVGVNREFNRGNSLTVFTDDFAQFVKQVFPIVG